MTQETVQTILATSGVLIGLYLAFFKSYFTEKGKNLATKEDIGEVTRIVEETKKQFTADTEYLKNRLNLFSQSFHSIKTLERDALIEINKKYSDWLHTLTSFSLVFYNYDNYELLKEYDFIFSNKQKEFEIAEDNLHLYMHDEELRKTKLNLTNHTSELQGCLLQHITLFMTNCKLYNQDRKNASIDQEVLLNQKYHEKQQPIIDKSLKDLVEIHKDITEYQVDFIKILNYRIYQLIQE
jgi:hypothetical protein